MQLWLEIGKLAAMIANSVVVAIIGVLLIRRVEGAKAFIAKQSDFQTKWAAEFFLCAQLFMQALEKQLTLLKFYAGLKDPNGKFGTDLAEEISRLSVTLTELELRIRRSVVFAPSAGGAATQAAKGCISLTAQLPAQQHGDLDVIVKMMNEFNVAARTAHAEMLGLSATKRVLQRTRS